MSNPLPILRNTTGTLNAQALYPFTRVASCLTFVDQFDNGSEQRWAGRTPLFNFALSFNSLSATDKASWLTFQNTVLGRLATNLTITLGATTYSNLTMMSDDLVATTRLPLLYDQQISLRQVSNYPYTVPTVGSTFPQLAFGTGGGIAVAELPFSQANSAFTDINESVYGQRFGFGWYKTGKTNFPNVLLKSWKISYPLLTDADAATLENYFLGKQGRYATFTFVDPIDGSSNANVRFDMDDLAFRYITKNMQSTEVSLKQIWV